MTDPRELRRTLHERHRQAFASVPIRLISKIDQEARTLLSAEDDRPYDGFSGAIGDEIGRASCRERVSDTV